MMTDVLEIRVPVPNRCLEKSLRVLSTGMCNFKATAPPLPTGRLAATGLYIKEKPKMWEGSREDDKDDEDGACCVVPFAGNRIIFSQRSTINYLR
jgi:hypothetical protein